MTYCWYHKIFFHVTTFGPIRWYWLNRVGYGVLTTVTKEFKKTDVRHHMYFTHWLTLLLLSTLYYRPNKFHTPPILLFVQLRSMMTEVDNDGLTLLAMAASSGNTSTFDTVLAAVTKELEKTEVRYRMHFTKWHEMCNIFKCWHRQNTDHITRFGKIQYAPLI